MTGYRHTTMTQAIASVLTRLDDPGVVRWLAAEAQAHIEDAFRTFAALTGLWQASDVAALPVNTTLFDIPTYFPALRGYTLTDRDLVSRLQYHLWEPPNGGSAWSGAGYTDMFTLAAVTEAIQRRRDQFLLETACRLTRHNPVPAAPSTIVAGEGSIQLDGAIMAVRRAAWVDTIGGKCSVLWPTSFASAAAANPLWNVDLDRPKTYLFAERAPSLMEVVPGPEVNGTLDLLTIDAGAALNPAAGVLLGVPDDFTPAIMWGAMADLLSNDGSARDYARSLFCQRRWNMLVAAAGVALTTIYAEIDGRPAQFSALEGLDQARPNWQNERGSPMLIALAGMNMGAIYPPPRRANGANVRLTTIRNAVITDADGYLQISKELLDVIMGYAVHLSMFKIGGEELAATTQLADAFFNTALDHNERLRELAVFERNRPAGQDEPDEREQRRGVRRVTGATVGSSRGGPTSGTV